MTSVGNGEIISEYVQETLPQSFYCLQKGTIFTTILIRQFHTELNQEGEPFVFDFRIQETTPQFYFQHSTEKDLAFVSVIDLFETLYRKQLQQVILAVALKTVVRKKKHTHPGNVLSCIIRLGKKAAQQIVTFSVILSHTKHSTWWQSFHFYFEEAVKLYIISSRVIRHGFLCGSTFNGS